MMPEGTLNESASTAVCPAKRLVTRSTMTGSDMPPQTTGVGKWRKGWGLGRYSEQLAGLAYGRDEGVDIVHVIIDVERGTRGRGDAEPAHQRLGAVVAGPNTDAVAVQDRRQVVRMNVAVRERHDAGTVVARSIDRDALDLRQALDRQAGQLLLVRGDVVHSQLLEIGDGGAKPDGGFDVRRSSFELVRNLVPRRAVVPHPLDHFAAAVVGRHRLEQRRLGDQRPASHGREHLVAG